MSTNVNDMQSDLDAYRASQVAPVIAGNSVPTGDMNQDLANYRANQTGQASPQQQPVQNQSSGSPWTDAQNQIAKNGAASLLPGNSAAPADNSKVDPGVVDKLNIINDGVNRGISRFGLNLLSVGTKIGSAFGMPDDQYKQVQGQIKQYDQQVQAQQDANIAKYSGNLAQASDLAGSMAATAPLGPLFGAVGKAAGAVGDAVAGGTGSALAGTAAKYGTSAVGNTAALSGIAGAEYNPDSPGFNVPGAEAAASDPKTWALGPAATYAQGWVKNANDLDQLKQTFPNARMQDLVQGKSPLRNGINMGLDAVPAMTGNSKAVAQMDDIGQPVGGFIQNLSGMANPTNTGQLLNMAGKSVQSAVQGMKDQGQKLWGEVPMDAPIADQEGLQSVMRQANSLIEGSTIAGKPEATNFLNQFLNKGSDLILDQNGIPNLTTKTLSVGDAKQVQTLIGKAATNAYNIDGGLGNDLGTQLMGLRNDVLNHMSNSVDGAGAEALAAARQHSSLLYKFQQQSPYIQQALTDETAGKSLIKAIIGDKGFEAQDRTQGAFNAMGFDGRNLTAATKLSQIMDQAGEGGAFGIQKFIDGTAENTNVPGLMGGVNSDAYQALQGFNAHLDNLNKAGTGASVGKNLMTGGATLGVPAALGFLHGGPLGAAAGVASYAAAHFAATYSPLKTLFSASMKNLPTSTQQYITKAIQNKFTTAGFFINQHGIMQHQSEQTVNPNIPQQGTQ